MSMSQHMLSFNFTSLYKCLLIFFLADTKDLEKAGWSVGKFCFKCVGLSWISLKHDFKQDILLISVLLTNVMLLYAGLAVSSFVALTGTVTIIVSACLLCHRRR